MQVKDVLQVSELLKRFPKGFAVTPSGKIFEIVSNFQKPSEAYAQAPPRDDTRAWGFLLVAVPLSQPLDQEKFGIKRIRTEDFYKIYDSQTFEDEAEAERVCSNINSIGVGIDHSYKVSYEGNGKTGFRLILLEESVGEKA